MKRKGKKSMKKINIFKYVFIIFIIVLAIVTFSIYKRENKSTERKSVVQENETNENVVRELRLAISQIDTINPIISKINMFKKLVK